MGQPAPGWGHNAPKKMMDASSRSCHVGQFERAAGLG